MWVYQNGKFINEEKATVSINNRSFRYGDGFFETMKVVNGKIQLQDFHIERLFSALQLLKFTSPSFFTPEYIIQRIQELVARNQQLPLARVRLVVHRGDGGLYDPVNLAPNLLIQSWSLSEESNRLNDNGLVIDVFNEGRKACDAYANLKSNNYLLYAMAALQAKQLHCNDMLVLNQHGRIADATIANIWIIEKGVLYTPSLEEGPVNGTVRRWLLEQAALKGLVAREEPVTLERLSAADEVFLTNAIYGLRWVKQFGETRYNCQLSASIHQQLLQPLWH